MAARSLPFRIKRRWLYITLIVLSCIVLFLIFGLPPLLGPRLSEQQEQWKEFQGDDPKGYPLEVVSHGYRMVLAYRSEPKKVPGKEGPAATLVEWEWKVVIKNKSNRNENVLVNYFLVDKDHLLVDVDYMVSPKPAPAWETVTIQHKTQMVYQDLPRIDTGVWEISWGEGKAFSQKKTRKY